MFTSIGCLIVFGVVLSGYFWILYIFHLVLKLVYPLKSAKLFDSDYKRAIFTVEVLSVLFIATVPSVVNAGLSKNRISTFPPTYCESYGAYHFYSVIIPIMTAVCVNALLMLVALYKVHVVSMMKAN